MHVNQDRGNFRTLVDTVMNIRVPLFVDQTADCWLL